MARVKQAVTARSVNLKYKNIYLEKDQNNLKK